MRIVIPDDYQDVIRTLDCFGKLSGHAVSVLHERQPATLEQLAARFADADALVLTRERTRIDAALLDRLPNLKLISQTGKVSSHLDLAACTARGIAVTEGRGSPVAPAELAWALILNARRQLVPAIDAFRQGQWQVNLGQALAGQLLGIWGYGKIGQRLARYAQAFDMPVLVWGSDSSRAAAQADGHRAAASRQAFFAEADIVSLNLRLSDQTRHGVTFDDLSNMKPDALLVNVSRAELIAPGHCYRHWMLGGRVSRRWMCTRRSRCSTRPIRCCATHAYSVRRTWGTWRRTATSCTSVTPSTMCWRFSTGCRRTSPTRKLWHFNA